MTTLGQQALNTEQPSPSSVANHTIDHSPAIGIHRLFEAQVEETPDAIAVRFTDQQLTYRALNQRANQLAHALSERGVGPEVLVGIYIERSLDMIVGLLGILKAGGAYLPLDPAYPAERLSFILEDTQVPLILTQSALRDRLPSHSTDIVCLDADWGAIGRHSTANPTVSVTASHLMYVIYTSGSTGQPKGVMIPHSGIWNQLAWRQSTFPLTQFDRVLQSISFSFDPSVWQIFWPLSVGAQLVLPVPEGHKDIPYLVDLMAQQQVTVMALVPSMLRVLLEQPGLDRCSQLKHVFCGGEALPADLIDIFYEKFTNTFLHNVYGPTEASIDATYWTCQPNTHYRIAPIGQAITNAQIYILDDSLQPVASGEAGELHIGGAGLARGYLNRAELTAAKFIAYPLADADADATHSQTRLYKTGDLARLLPDGNLEFLGRIDHQVKIRGFRIELGEIEIALSQHPGLAENVVIARADASENQRLIAYVVPQAEQRPTPAELRQFLQAKLPDYMVPAAIVVLEALPLNANGKLDRQALLAPAIEHPDRTTGVIGPRDALELELVQIWEQILNMRPISITDNFFDLGGDSLLAARLLTQLETACGQTLPLAIFQQAATVEQLADCIRQQNWSLSQQPLVAIQPQGTQPPLFCIHSRTQTVLNYFPLARHLPTDRPVYGLQPRTTDASTIAQRSIESIAADYIQEIQTLQPTAPYLLLGYSFGGLIAYEMARQLLAQGQTALLVMVDTYNSQETWFKPIAGQNHRLNRLAIHRDELRRRSWQEKIRYLRQLLDRSTTIESAFEQITRKYTPQAYPGEAILFRATQAPASSTGVVGIDMDQWLGWSSLIDRLQVHNLDCDHFSIMFDPFVGQLAAGLQSYLAKPGIDRGTAD